MLNLRMCSFLASFSVLPIPSVAAGDFDAMPAQQGHEQGRWGLTVGGFGGFAPAYEGSDVYRFGGNPLIIPKYYGDRYDPNEVSRVTFRGIDDVRISALRFGQLSAGPVVGYNFGRDESDAALLRGMGNIDGGLNVGGFAALHFAPFFVDAAYVTQVTGSNDLGYTIRLGAGWEQKISERLKGQAYLSTAYASEDYMNSYFSVSPAQSAASGGRLASYNAGAGFKNISLELGADYKLTERWTLKSKVGYSHLIGDAANSPITASRSQFSGGFGLTYTFGRIR